MVGPQRAPDRPTVESGIETRALRASRGNGPGSWAPHPLSGEPILLTCWITKVAIDGEGRILVYPALASDRDFEHIHRAARGAYWDDSERAIYAAAPVTSSYSERFSHIVSAAASEYGCRLVLSPEATWSNVPRDVRESILAANGSTTGAPPTVEWE